jgi:hypothetical protein
MTRREFLSAFGLGATEVCIVKRVSATSFIPKPTIDLNDPVLNDPVWIKRFGGKSTAVLIRSRKFRSFIEARFPGVVAPFHSNLPLWAAVWSWMDNPGPVTTYHHRYVVATGCMAHFAPCRGMVWIDACRNNPSPLVVLAFMSVGLERELWIISNWSLATLPPSDLPHHLTMTISRWLRERRPIRSDGGYLTRLVIYDASPEGATPLPLAWGVKPYRCQPNMVVQSVSNGLPSLGRGMGL